MNVIALLLASCTMTPTEEVPTCAVEVSNSLVFSPSS